MTSPTARRDRALRIAGLALAILVALIASPFLIAKLFIDQSGERR